jgi:hypothetical protein
MHQAEIRTPRRQTASTFAGRSMNTRSQHSKLVISEKENDTIVLLF